MRATLIFERRTSSACDSRCFDGIILDRNACAALAATAYQNVSTRLGHTTRTKAVRFCSFALLWLPCSFHWTTIPDFFLFSTPPSESGAQKGVRSATARDFRGLPAGKAPYPFAHRARETHLPTLSTPYEQRCTTCPSFLSQTRRV